MRLTYRCPIHGEVEGTIHMDGPLSDCFPTPVLCEEAHDYGCEVIVGYDDDEEVRDD